MDTIDFVKKEYKILSNGPLEDFIGCTIKCDLINITLIIYQENITTKMTQVFSNDVKIYDFKYTSYTSQGGCNQSRNRHKNFKQSA